MSLYRTAFVFGFVFVFLDPVLPDIIFLLFPPSNPSRPLTFLCNINSITKYHGLSLLPLSWEQYFSEPFQSPTFGDLKGLILLLQKSVEKLQITAKQALKFSAHPLIQDILWRKKSSVLKKAKVIVTPLELRFPENIKKCEIIPTFLYVSTHLNITNSEF